MNKIAFIAFILGMFASSYNITHINYQIERRTLQDMVAARAIVHWKWENGCLGNPMQYRCLVDFVISKLSPKFFICQDNGKIFEMNYSPLVRSVLASIVITWMFILSAIYYKKLGFDDNKVVVGIFMFFLAYVIGVSNESISLNSYFDLCFYLLTSLVLLCKKSRWIIFIFMPIAAFNRETCFFIPWIIISLIFFRKENKVEYLKPFLLLVIWAIVFFAVRRHFPPQAFNFGHFGSHMGLNQIKANLMDIESFSLWIVFPISAAYLFFFKREFLHHYIVHGIALPMVALTAVSFVGGTVNELRVFIVPICLFLIPTVLTERKPDVSPCVADYAI
jgi:hypothetical protein